MHEIQCTRHVFYLTAIQFLLQFARLCTCCIGVHMGTVESTESLESAVVANRSSEPTKFLSCEPQFARLTNMLKSD